MLKYKHNAEMYYFIYIHMWLICNYFYLYNFNLITNSKLVLSLIFFYSLFHSLILFYNKQLVIEIIYFFRAGGREREKQLCVRDKSIRCLHMHTTQDQTRTLGMCPGWGLNLQPSGAPTEPHRPGEQLFLSWSEYSIVAEIIVSLFKCM